MLALLCLCSAASLARVALGRSASVACLATPLTRLSRVYNSTARALGPLHTPDSAARPAARSTETPEGRPHTNRDPASRASGSPGYLGLGCRKRAETQHGASATAEARRAAPPRPLVLAAASRPPPPCACSALLVLCRLFIYVMGLGLCTANRILKPQTRIPRTRVDVHTNTLFLCFFR